jgi:hypothetical protein
MRPVPKKRTGLKKPLKKISGRTHTAGHCYAFTGDNGGQEVADVIHRQLVD